MPESDHYILVETAAPAADLFESELLVPYAIHTISGEVEWCIAEDLTDIELAITEVSEETEAE